MDCCCWLCGGSRCTEHFSAQQMQPVGYGELVIWWKPFLLVVKHCQVLEKLFSLLTLNTQADLVKNFIDIMKN